jgi:hypothetical protein
MKTLALIIGNNEYYEGAKLKNAINDAVSINQVFERLGFDIISKYDCKAADYSVLLSKFEERIINYDASIFYFAGHGFELAGENYLAATDCQIPPPDKYYASRYSISLNELLDIYKKNAGKVNIVIIDACRRAFDRSGNIVLAPMFAPKGTLVAFSTSPNDGASDVGFEGHSIYTGALLKYIGRQQLSVEELFKKVRKTVFALSEGKQTTWEHTSLINDYYFNTGQLVHSISIPYDENVVKDVNYCEVGNFGELIMALKSYNWNIQNPAISTLLRIPASELDKNQQFILGRNLLQASSAAIMAGRFMESINANIARYNSDGENHLLNGILFEIYFNSYAEFRKDKTKTYYFKELISLRKIESLKKSFDFIRNLIESTGYQLIYFPKAQDEFLDIDVVASPDTTTNNFGDDVTYQVISNINYNGIDITKKIAYYNLTGRNEQRLKHVLHEFFVAPEELIQINSNIVLDKIAFIKSITEEVDDW